MKSFSRRKSLLRMRKKTSRSKSLLIPALLFSAVLAAAFLCSRYLFQLALVQGDSMEPRYHHLQLVIVDKRPREYAAGDVIVFRKSGIDGVLIKRVAAGPGDRVRIAGGLLYVNGEPVPGMEGIKEAGRAERELLSGDGCFFVIGDNVNHSIDSRMAEIGDVLLEEILGRVIFPRP